VPCQQSGMFERSQKDLWFSTSLHTIMVPMAFVTLYHMPWNTEEN